MGVQKERTIVKVGERKNNHEKRKDKIAMVEEEKEQL